MSKFTQTFILLFISFSAFSQTIIPPKLICVTTLFDGNVELTWELPPPQNCGAFLGYRIYATPNPSAPYFLLATVTNQNQTTFTHVNANGNTQTWYYYLSTDLQCPTWQVDQSEVLDNLDPETPPITSVSINNAGNIVLNWEASTSPETDAYVIYQETNSGFVAIDTIFGGVTTYEHIGVDSETRQTYTIAAMDLCGNIGLLYDNPHQTILLNAVVNRCEQTIDLTWNPYESWDSPVAAYQIRTGLNGGNLTLLKTVAGSATSVSLENYTDGDNVCITAQAVELGTGEASTTQQVCVTYDIVEPMDYIYLSNVSINNNNDLEIFWNWDADSDIESFAIVENGNELTLPAPNPVQPLSYYLDTAINADTASLKIQVASTDSCGLMNVSTIGQTIFLKGSAGSNYENFLRWTPFTMEYTTVYSYEIYRIVEDIPELIGSVQANQLNFTDEVSGYDENQADIRYYVVAQAFINLPDGTAKAIFSQSNTILIEQQSKIFMPNAFAPEGINDVFKPVLVFSENSTFQMIIYDRWGRLLFETTDPSTGWNGRKSDGKIMRQGVYTYIVRVTQLNGDIIERKGTLLLIR